MNNSARSSLLPVTLALITLLGTSACVPRIKPSPYIKALNQYYAALDEAGKADALPERTDEERHIKSQSLILAGNRLSAVEQKVTAELLTSGASPELRMLQANIKLTRYRRESNKQSDTAKALAKAVVREVQYAVSALSSQAESAEWVLPRSHILMGDLILLTYEGFSPPEQTDENSVKDGLIALASYEIAAAHYAKAKTLAEEELKNLPAAHKSYERALRSQIEYAISGLHVSLTNQLNLVSQFYPEFQSQLINDLNGLTTGDARVWQNSSGKLPGSVLDERDPQIVAEITKAQILFEGAEPQGSLDRLRRAQLALRLSVLGEIRRQPGVQLSVTTLPDSQDKFKVKDTVFIVFNQLNSLGIKIDIRNVANKKEVGGQSLTLAVSPGTTLRTPVLSTLILKQGSKSIEFPQPIEKSGQTVRVLIQIKTPITWIIHFGTNSSSALNDVVVTRTSDLITQVDQYLNLIDPFFVAGDENNILQIRSIAGALIASAAIPAPSPDAEVEKVLADARRAATEKRLVAATENLRSASSICATLEKMEAHQCYLKVAIGFTILPTSPAASAAIIDSLKNASAKLIAVSDVEKLKSRLRELEFFVDYSAPEAFVKEQYQIIKRLFDDQCAATSAPEGCTRFRLVNAELTAKYPSVTQ